MIDLKWCDYTNIYYYDGYIWYITNVDNFLMKVDIFTGKIYFEKNIPSGNKYCSHSTMAFLEGYIYILPNYSNRFFKYNINTKELVEIICRDEIYMEEHCSIRGCKLIGNSIIMNGYVSRMIYKLDINTDDIVAYSLSSLMESKKDWIFRDIINYGTEVFVPLYNNNNFINFKYSNATIKNISISNVHEDLVYRITKQLDCYVYDLHVYEDWKLVLFRYNLNDKNEKAKIISSFCIEKNSSERCYTPSWWGDISEKFFILMPGVTDYIIRINLDTGEVFRTISKIANLSNNCRIGGICHGAYCFSGCKVNMNTVSVIYPFDGIMSMTSIDTGNESMIRLYFEDAFKESILETLKEQLISEAIIKENVFFSLNDFLQEDKGDYYV